MNYTRIIFLCESVYIRLKKPNKKRGDIEMKKLVLAVIFLAAGSLLADADTKSFCSIFECKSQDAIHVRTEWTSAVQKMCDSHKNADGTYNIKFCDMMDFYSNGSVILKDIYVEDFKKLCTLTAQAEEKEEEMGWFMKALIDFGKTPMYWRH